MAETIQCPSCGANAKKIEENCEYCGNYLVHLSPFERKKAPSGSTGASVILFRSLAPIYYLCIIGSFGSMVAIYTVYFNDLSETMLVNIAPSWFLAFHFGITGLFTEKAVIRVLTKKAATFKEGLDKAFVETSFIISMIARITFLPPYLLLPLKKISSPFLLAVFTTAAWAGLLYFFFTFLCFLFISFLFMFF